MIGHFCLTSNDHCQLRLRSDSVTLRGCQGRHSCFIYRHTKDSVAPRSTSPDIILSRDCSWRVSRRDGTVFCLFGAVLPPALSESLIAVIRVEDQVELASELRGKLYQKCSEIRGLECGGLCVVSYLDVDFHSCLQHISYQCLIMGDNGAVVSLQGCHVTCHIVCVKIHCVCHMV